MANLDIKYQLEILKLLKSLKAKKDISILMALHDINFALQFEKVMLIKDGMILGFGRPEDILTGVALKEAFDVDIEIHSQDSGQTYVRFRD